MILPKTVRILNMFKIKVKARRTLRFQKASGTKIDLHLPARKKIMNNYI